MGKDEVNSASRPPRRPSYSAYVLALREATMTSKGQAYFWTEDWQRKERQADADIRAGRTFQAPDVEALIAHLHDATDAQGAETAPFPKPPPHVGAGS